MFLLKIRIYDTTPERVLGVASEPSYVTPPIEPSRWEYRSGKDEMRGTHWWQAVLESEDGPALKFPYEGGSPVSLVLAKTAGEPDDDGLTIVLANGQFNCSAYRSINSCLITVKMDDGKPFELNGTTHDCGSNHCMHLEKRTSDWDARDISNTPLSSAVEVVKQSKYLTIELPIFDLGDYQCHFKAGGLVWPQSSAQTGLSRRP